MWESKRQHVYGNPGSRGGGISVVGKGTSTDWRKVLKSMKSQTNKALYGNGAVKPPSFKSNFPRV